jgi:SAM-dependent methyltransferase
MREDETTPAHPGAGLKTEKMPGHWVLARLGKRVLRPGGMELTRLMLKRLAIKPSDDVIEFAPGMGATARLTLALAPSSYTAVERDEAAAKIVSSYLAGTKQKCVLGSASATGLPAESATVVYGEAMLTMQTEELKRCIVREAHRLLKHGGRYGIHEMCLMHESLNDDARQEVELALTGVVHHGVRPLTLAEWRLLLESEGFEVKAVETASMSLLEPRRLIKDEGVVGAILFALNVLRDGQARRRVFEMRRTFRRNRKLLGAVALMAIKQ